MRRGLSIGLASVALLNLWAVSAGPLAQEPAAPAAPAPPAAASVAGASQAPPAPAATHTPQGGRAAAVTATGNQPETTPERHSKVQAAGAGSVSIKDFSFGPSSITVNVGDTVTWSNAGPAEHTATAGSFDTGILKKGQSGSHTFNTAGTFRYICSVHPFMRGTVVVAAAAGTSAPSTSSPAPKTATPAATPEPGTPGAAAPAQPGGLPNSGVDVGWLVLSGALLTASGLLLRRRATDS